MKKSMLQLKKREEEFRSPTRAKNFAAYREGANRDAMSSPVMTEPSILDGPLRNSSENSNPDPLNDGSILEGGLRGSADSASNQTRDSRAKKSASGVSANADEDLEILCTNSKLVERNASLGDEMREESRNLDNLQNSKAQGMSGSGKQSGASRGNSLKQAFLLEGELAQAKQEVEDLSSLTDKLRKKNTALEQALEGQGKCKERTIFNNYYWYLSFGKSAYNCCASINIMI
jgi:hypothetical protein